MIRKLREASKSGAGADEGIEQRLQASNAPLCKPHMRIHFNKAAADILPPAIVNRAAGCSRLAAKTVKGRTAAGAAIAARVQTPAVVDPRAQSMSMTMDLSDAEDSDEGSEDAREATAATGLFPPTSDDAKRKRASGAGSDIAPLSTPQSRSQRRARKPDPETVEVLQLLRGFAADKDAISKGPAPAPAPAEVVQPLRQVARLSYTHPDEFVQAKALFKMCKEHKDLSEIVLDQVSEGWSLEKSLTWAEDVYGQPWHRPDSVASHEY